MKRRILFSVVIPTCHRNDLLSKCLDCLAPGKQASLQLVPATRSDISPSAFPDPRSLSSSSISDSQGPLLPSYEVIVSDDGTATTAERMIREDYPWAQWLPGPQKGPAANRNNGARIARGAWLAFTDDDCLPDGSWLKVLAEAINGASLALEGAIEPIGNADGDLDECPVNLDGGHFWSANIAVERNLFQEIGGFDESFPMAAHEDQDLMLRLKAKTRIAFIREAIVRHPVRSRGLAESIALLPARCRAWALFAYKHRATLGYNNVWGIVFSALLTQGRYTIHFLRRYHFRKAILCVLTMIVGVPVIYRFLKHPRREVMSQSPELKWPSEGIAPRQNLANSLIGFIRITKYRLDFVTNYFRAFGVVGTCQLFRLKHLSPHRKGETIEVRHSSLGATLFLRLGTSDISVFESIFVWDQYAFSFAAPPKTILDGGGNIGLSVAWFATRFPDAQIVVIEPDAANYALLLRNTATFRNVKLLQAGIWSRDCFVRVKEEDVRADSFSFEPCEPGISGATKAYDIATIAARFGIHSFDLVKLDIEGAEEELFTNHVERWLCLAKMIVVECHTPAIRETVRGVLRAPDWQASRCGENDIFVRQAVTRPLPCRC